MTFSFASLRVRLLFLVFLALIPALVLIFYHDVDQKHRVAAESKVEAMRLVGLAATGQKQFLDEARQLLEDLSKLVDVDPDHRSHSNALLAGELERHPQYVNFGIASLDGSVFCSALPLNQADANVNISDRHYFQRTLRIRDFAVGSYQMGRIARTFTINFGYPILSGGGELQGVLFAALDLSYLVRAAVQAQLPEGAVLTIRDSTGTILFRYPEHERWFGLSLPEAPIVKFILSHQGWGTAEAAGIDGIRRLYAFAPLSNSIDPVVYLSVGLESKIAFSKADKQMFHNLVWLGLVTLLALAAAWFGGSFFVMNQVNALMNVTRRLTAGDLSARFGASYDSSELGELAHAFDDMAESLDRRSTQLQKAEAKYRALVERVPAITYVMLLEEPGKMLYVSPQIEIILGFSPAEWLYGSKAWLSQLHPDDRDRVLAELNQNSPSGGPLKLEYRLFAKDGHPVWVRDESQIFQGDDSRSFVIQGIMRDITERKLSEQALRQSQEALRLLGRKHELILESAGEGIFGLDCEGNVTFMNPAASRMIGWELQEIVGRSHHDIVHHTKPDGTSYPQSECPIYAAFRDRNIHRAPDEVFWRKDGTSFPIEYISTPVYEDGKPAGAVVCVKDIGERKATQEELRESEEKFFLAFKHAPVMAAISVPEDGTYLDVNDKFVELRGFTREEVLGKTSIEVGWLKAEDRLRLIETLQEQGKVSGMEITSYAKDGRPMDCLYHCELVTIGGVKRLLTMVLDITERKQAEDEANLQRETLARVFESSPYIMMLVNKDGRVTNINHTGVAFAGRPKEGLLGLLGGDVFSCLNSFDGLGCGRNPECGNCPVRTRVMHTFETGQDIYDAEGSLTVRKDPMDIAVAMLISTSLVSAKDGDQVLVTITDTTERKKAEVALRDSEEFKKAILDSVSPHIAVLDRNGSILSVNEPWARFAAENSNMESTPALHTGPGVNYLEICMESHGESAEGAMAAHEGILAVLDGTLPGFSLEYPCHSPGIKRWFIMTVTPLGTGARGVVISHTNITGRKRAEDALREGEARLDLAIHSANMGVWSWDIHENKRYFDNKVCYLLGIDPDKFTGMSEQFFGAVHPDDHATIRAALHRAVTEDVLYETDYRVVWPDRSVHYIRARGRLLRDEASQPKEINGVIWDITERKRAQEEREKLEAQLRQAQKLEAIGTLAGGIAHDFNNILAAIMGYTEMVLYDIPENAASHHDLEQVLRATHRAKDLVQQILAFSRQGEIQARQPIAVDRIIKEALTLLRATLPTTIEFRQDISNESETIMGDPTQLHQVVVNLCTNAAHAMRETGGVLEVTLGRIEFDAVSSEGYENLQPGSFVKLTVKDTGHGMDSNTIERIFDPYFTTKAVGEGSGLGLAVIQGIVKRHEGAISVQSEPGKGTVFEILLPGIEKSQEPIEVGLQPGVGGIERILFVDDEEALAGLFEEILAQLGYHVTTRTNSLEAIELFRADPDGFDLVITDYTMPHMTGMDLARAILQIRSNIPIVLCTGYSEMVSKQKAKDIGIRAFVMKPFGSRNMSEVIRTVLDGKND